MALGQHNAAAVEEGPPPLRHWTRDSLQEDRIARVFPLTSGLEAEPAIVGAELVMVLVKDQKRNDLTPLADLKGETCSKTLKCHVTLGQLVENLEKQQSFPKSFTFARARLLIEEGGKDVATCLETGFKYLRIRFFPDLKYRDVSGHKRATWNFTHFLEVHQKGEEPSVEAQAMSLVEDLCMEIERRGLCYAQSLELPKRMGKARRFLMLVFVSCVGMLMNNDFIAFDKLKNLIIDMGPEIHVSKVIFMPVATTKHWEPKEIAITNTHSSVKPGGVYKDAKLVIGPGTTPYHCQMVLCRAEEDITKIHKSLGKGCHVTEEQKTRLRYYCIGLLILRMFLKP
ncbi:hypothetical protein CRENBAI_002276 [Crenichthys baileyi]|uniref:Uncharacterized protein n=1 Tax=Crenichthys baileyi TaxID=28760 RepID=A0AAV9RVN3_9TELE